MNATCNADRSAEWLAKKEAGHTGLYNKWVGMRYRCRVEKCKSYPRYGGRGISVCDSWNESFDAFRAWAISSGFVVGLTIDRIDNDGNYEPSNCRWITFSENSRRRNAPFRRLNMNGVRDVFRMRRDGIKRCDIARHFGVDPNLIGRVIGGITYKTFTVGLWEEFGVEKTELCPA